MLPLTTRHSLINSLMPDNPKPGEEFSLPDKQVLGASILVSVYIVDDLIGDAVQLAAVPNVSGKALLSRVTTRIPLRRGMRIRVVSQQFSFDSIVFVQHFGWLGCHALPEATQHSSTRYRIEHVLRVGPDTDKFYIYEKVCLTQIEEKQ